MDEQVEKEKTRNRKLANRVVQAILYFWGVVFILVAILLFFNPALAEETIGFGGMSAKILAAALFFTGLCDFIIGKIVFGKSERI